MRCCMWTRLEAQTLCFHILCSIVSGFLSFRLSFFLALMLSCVSSPLLLSLASIVLETIVPSRAAPHTPYTKEEKTLTLLQPMAPCPSATDPFQCTFPFSLQFLYFSVEKQCATRGQTPRAYFWHSTESQDCPPHSPVGEEEGSCPTAGAAGMLRTGLTEGLSKAGRLCVAL